MSRASFPTLLALDRYAAILGINPAHFNGAMGTSVLTATGSCPAVWFQYAWQAGDRISREELAEAIQQAEFELARLVGYWPAPVWTCDELHDYPRFFRREYFTAGLDIRGNLRSIRTNWARVISPGRRSTITIDESFTVVYDDLDGDGYDETAIIQFNTTLTDPCEIKVYFENHCGEPEWEIRPARRKEIDAGVFTATYWAWQFIKPDLWEAFPPASGAKALDLADSIYVENVCVVRETTDVSQASAVFLWEPTNVCPICGGSGCSACSLTSQDGCIRIRDGVRGLVAPMPGTYDEDRLDWCLASWTECREPDQVKLWYLSGDLDNRNLCGEGCEPLSNFWAETITWLATARLLKPVCDCFNITAKVADLQTDLAFAPSGGPGTYTLGSGELENPLGTKKGEIKAWRRVRNIIPQRGKVALA